MKGKRFSKSPGKKHLEPSTPSPACATRARVIWRVSRKTWSLDAESIQNGLKEQWDQNVAGKFHFFPFSGLFVVIYQSSICEVYLHIFHVVRSHHVFFNEAVWGVSFTASFPSRRTADGGMWRLTWIPSSTASPAGSCSTGAEGNGWKFRRFGIGSLWKALRASESCQVTLESLPWVFLVS